VGPKTGYLADLITKRRHEVKKEPPQQIITGLPIYLASGMIVATTGECYTAPVNGKYTSLTCTSCGAPLPYNETRPNRFECKYCGTILLRD
jgi:predicted RNA-binding Zn-ribbon protein involved in translation (DUF1610 family)